MALRPFLPQIAAQGMEKKLPSHHGNGVVINYKLYAIRTPFLLHNHNQSLSRYKVVYAA